MSYLYHYTGQEGLLAISQSGYIKQSSIAAGDAFYGNGVYLTGIDPSASDEDIVKNNWDDNNPAAIKRLLQDPNVVAKTKFVIAIPKVSIPEAKKVGDKDGRDVWLYQGDLVLKGKGVQYWKRTKL